MIPARIFQTWKDKATIPANFRAWSETFRNLNPGFQYELWDDGDNRRFIATEFPWFAEIYAGYPAEIYRVDAVRYFYLYLFGGIYADLDTACLKPLDDLTRKSGVLLGRMGIDEKFNHSIPNAIMAASPRCEFWLFVISLLMHFSVYRARPELITGPVVLKSAVDLYLANDPLFVESKVKEVARLLGDQQRPAPGKSRIELLESRRWYPLNWNDPVHDVLRQRVLSVSVPEEVDTKQLFRNSEMVTYWAHSWE